MSHGQQPGRRSWIRRHRFAAVLGAVAVTLIAAGILRAVPSGPSGHDYRDAAQLAEAMKQAHRGAAASCGKLPTGKYFCDVAFSDGTSGTYTVTVAPDGSSYQAS